MNQSNHQSLSCIHLLTWSLSSTRPFFSKSTAPDINLFAANSIQFDSRDWKLRCKLDHPLPQLLYALMFISHWTEIFQFLEVLFSKSARGQSGSSYSDSTRIQCRFISV